MRRGVVRMKSSWMLLNGQLELTRGVVRRQDTEMLLAFARRYGSDIAEDLADAGTADPFTEVSRGLEKSLWFLEAHLQE
jgi:hypothetical protein